MYEGAEAQRAYGYHSPTYQAAADWLAPCHTVEDFGGGLAWFRRFLRPDQRYRNIDGTASMFCDEVADLATYRPDPLPDGVLMRHVLEHCELDGWRAVLDNVLRSFRKRAVIVVYTPFGDVTRDLGDDESGLNVPVLSFKTTDLFEAIQDAGLWPGFGMSLFHGDECGHYGQETVFYLERTERWLSAR